MHFKQSKLKTLVTSCLISTFLTACNDSNNDSFNTEPLVLTENDTNPSVFISSVDINGLTTDNLKSVKFTIEAKNGALAEPISATFDADSLEKETNSVNLPIYGMYSNFDNTVDIEVTYTDDSVSYETITIPTAAFSDTNDVLSNPIIDIPLSSKDNIGFSYFLLKNFIDGPTIFDIDGNPRWAQTPEDAIKTQSVTINDQGKLISHKNSIIYTGTLYGDSKAVPFTVDGLSSISAHHNLEPGKTTDGYLFSIDADQEGHSERILESILLEVNTNGDVINTWDFGEIISQYLIENGEDPSDFVRDGVDWFHINSAIYDKDNDAIIVSSREHFVISVGYETHEINWILGATNKYWFEGYPAFQALALNSDMYAPNGQHALSILNNGNLSLFNNNNGSANTPEGTSTGDKTGPSYLVEYKIDPSSRTAETDWVYDDGTYSSVCSSVYSYKDDSKLALYAVADESSKIIFKIFSSNNHDTPAFKMHFEKTTALFCDYAWNAMPVNITDINY